MDCRIKKIYTDIYSIIYKENEEYAINRSIKYNIDRIMVNLSKRTIWFWAFMDSMSIIISIASYIYILYLMQLKDVELFYWIIYNAMLIVIPLCIYFLNPNTIFALRLIYIKYFKMKNIEKLEIKNIEQIESLKRIYNDKEKFEKLKILNGKYSLYEKLKSMEISLQNKFIYQALAFPIAFIFNKILDSKFDDKTITIDVLLNNTLEIILVYTGILMAGSIIYYLVYLGSLNFYLLKYKKELVISKLIYDMDTYMLLEDLKINEANLNKEEPIENMCSFKDCSYIKKKSNADHECENDSFKIYIIGRCKNMKHKYDNKTCPICKKKSFKKNKKNWFS